MLLLVLSLLAQHPQPLLALLQVRQSRRMLLLLGICHIRLELVLRWVDLARIPPLCSLSDLAEQSHALHMLHLHLGWCRQALSPGQASSIAEYFSWTALTSP